MEVNKVSPFWKNVNNDNITSHLQFRTDKVNNQMQMSDIDIQSDCIAFIEAQDATFLNYPGEYDVRCLSAMTCFPSHLSSLKLLCQ